MSPLRFSAQSQAVFVSGKHLSREQAFLAAARVRLKPAVVQAPLPTCALVSDDAAEVTRFLDDARAAELKAWSIGQRDLTAAERVNRIEVRGSEVELTTTLRLRRVFSERLSTFVDLRWKQPTLETRVLVFGALDTPLLLAPLSTLELTGPSRQGALMKVLADVTRALQTMAAERRVSVVLGPAQLQLPVDLPAEVMALGLAMGSVPETLQGAGRR